MLELAKIKGLFPLDGEKVGLRLFRENDISEPYISWLNDAVVVRYSSQRFKQHSASSCRQYFSSFATNNGIFLAITAKGSEKMIGTMTVYFDLQNDVADIGILVGEKGSWGTGIGRDAWVTVVNLLVGAAQVRKVTGGTLACNQPMVRIMRAAGMQEDGLRRAQGLVDGEPVDVLHFAKMRL